MGIFPVERSVLLSPLHQYLTEHLPHVIVVRLLLKLQLADVLKVTLQHQTILSKGLDEVVDLSHFLPASDLGVFFSLRVDLNALPWQLSDEKVKHQVAQRLQIVSATLLKTLVRRNTGIAGCPH